MSAAVLIDTHILIWLRTGAAPLLEKESSAINNAHARYISPVSFWEIALLIGVGKLGSDHRFFDIPSGFDLLPILPKHCQAVLELPMLHRDPYDRLLIAQAKTDSLLLVSRDGEIQKYGAAGLVQLAS